MICNSICIHEKFISLLMGRAQCQRHMKKKITKLPQNQATNSTNQVTNSTSRHKSGRKSGHTLSQKINKRQQFPSSKIKLPIVSLISVKQLPIEEILLTEEASISIKVGRIGDGQENDIRYMRNILRRLDESVESSKHQT